MFMKNIYFHEKFKNELNIEIAKRKQLTKKIKNLPNDIQKKIYIFSYKEYWKYLTLQQSYLPSYYNHSLQIKKQLSDAIFKNIHFLHLDMNTLPENKKWIMGCQCDFCLHDNSIHKIHKYKMYNDYINCDDRNEYFLNHIKCFHCYENNWALVDIDWDFHIFNNDNYLEDLNLEEKKIRNFNPLYKFPNNKNPHLNLKDYPLSFCINHN
tara:strand:- start:339 stop:965 length:627 start_codon:yes stop_codon:yes gene_type:complete